MARRIAVGLLAGLVLSAPFALAPASAQTTCGVVRGTWETIAGPSFPSGSKAITSFSLAPEQPSTIFTSNGQVVMKSANGGCDWAPSYKVQSLASSPLPDAAGQPIIEGIAMPEVKSPNAYLMVEEAVGPAVRPRVIRTINSGGSWQEASAGLPPTGAPALIRVAPSAPNTVYLAIAVGGTVELLYGSDDAGTSWTLRSNFGRGPGLAINDLKVDPLNPNELWVGAADGMFHSTDGGRTFRAIDEFVGKSTGPVDVFHDRNGAASVLGFLGAGGALLSDDGGENWLRLQSPGNPTSVAHGSSPLFRMISSVGRVWVYTPNLFSWVDVRAPTPNTTGLIGALTPTPSFYGFSPSTIEIYRGPVGLDVVIPPDIDIRPDTSLLPLGPPPPPRPAKLTPNRKVVRIDAGDSKTVPFNLVVPQTKTPLDVYFVIDTSSSQKAFIEGMARALETIVNELARSGADVQLGLAEYRDYPDSDGPRVGSTDPFDEPNFVYRRRQPIAPSTTGIEQALDTIEPEGGGQYNAQLEALYQSATGAGVDVQPAGPLGNDVPPGQQAGFRREALRVAVLVSDDAFVDEPYDKDPTPPDLRSFDEAAEALRDNDIKQVGLSLISNNTAPATPFMVEMAKRTGAVAASGGVDCDGDGSSDVGTGEPLVCSLDQESLGADTALAEAIVNLVESVRTTDSVSLAVKGRDDIIKKVAPQEYEAVVLQASNELTFDVTFRCPLSLAGERFPVSLGTEVDPSAKASATVICRTVANSQNRDEEEDDPLLQIPFDQVLGLIPLVPVGPPPPVTELASSTQAQAQSQAQAQAQASMAAQEQQQPQLAFVHAVHAMRQKAAEEYAMSSLRDREPVFTPERALAGATILMGLGFGVAMSRRTGLRVRRTRR